MPRLTRRFALLVTLGGCTWAAAFSGFVLGGVHWLGADPWLWEEVGAACTLVVGSGAFVVGAATMACVAEANK